MTEVMTALDLQVGQCYRLKESVWLLGGATMHEDIASGKNAIRLLPQTIFLVVGLRATRKPTIREWLRLQGPQPLAAPRYQVTVYDQALAEFAEGWIDSIALMGYRGVALVEAVAPCPASA